MPLSALKFHTLQITFFPPWLREHIHLPTHTPSFRPIMPKKRTKHLFLKITFFFLHSFSLPPKHFLIIFSGKQTTKNGQESSLKEKKKVSFFLIFSHFPSPITEKNKTTYFFRPFITGNRRTAKENVPYKIFFSSFFLTFLRPTALRNRKNCHLPFFRNSDLKYPKMPLSALKFHILQITFFPP